MNQLDRHFEWLRSAVHSGHGLTTGSIFRASWQVRELDERFHREVWLPYLEGFYGRTRENIINRLDRAGPERFSHLEHVMIQGTNLLDVFGLNRNANE